MGKFSKLIESTVDGKETVLTHVESVLKAFNEKTEEYKAHHSSITGHTYHMNKDHSEKLHKIAHGKTDSVEAVHHDGNKLHLKHYDAHRFGNTIHLHDEDGKHVDSIAHRRE